MNFSRIFKYASIALILLLFIGLGGWYVYLRKETSSIVASSQGRGFSASIPTSGKLGSTFSNIVSGFRGTLRSGAETDGAQENFGISDFSGGVKSAFGSLISGLGSLAPKDASSTIQKMAPRLHHAHKSPVAGFGFIKIASTTVRFMERSSGYLFDVNPETGEVRRVTNTLVPKVYDAKFARDGSPVLQTLEAGTRVVYSARVSTSTTPESLAALSMTSLGSRVDALPHAISRELIMLVEGEGVSAIVKSAWGGSKPASLFTSSIAGWRMHWPPDNKIYIAQNAATGIPGSAYRLLNNGSLVPLARSILGLTILPKATSTALIMGSDNGVVSTFVRSEADAAFVELPIRTIADKCVWAAGAAPIAYCAVPANIPSSQFISEWYRGEVHTADAWWRVDAREGSADLVYSPTREVGVSLDVESPRMDDDGKYIAFIDAHDKSLWILRLSE